MTDRRKSRVLLGRRYANNSKPLRLLNVVQRKALDQLQHRIDNGYYSREYTRCAVCGADDYHTLSEKDRYGLAYRVVICHHCGLIYANPRLSMDAYAKFYDREYRPLYHGHSRSEMAIFEKGVARGKEIELYFRANSIVVSGRRVLDIGCGAGGTLAYLRDSHECQVYGCDYGAKGIQYGIEQYGLDLCVGSVSDTKLPWRPDIIICSHVVENFLDLARECGTIRDVLQDDGLVYVEVPSVRSVRERWRWDVLKLLQNAHTYYFTLRTLTNVMQKNGFIRVHGSEYVRAIFKKGPAVVDFVDDSGTLYYLRNTERLRPLMAPLLFITSRLKRLIAKVL